MKNKDKKQTKYVSGLFQFLGGFLHTHADEHRKKLCTKIWKATHIWFIPKKKKEN